MAFGPNLASLSAERREEDGDGFMTHILVVDDEPDILGMLTRLLDTGPDVRVTTARRASVARAILMREGADLVITDARMPGENGIALAKLADELGIPAIIMTGDHDWAIEKGAERELLLVKPFDVAVMRNLVSRLLDTARRS
jgi:DNA-binding NtrC family response regulator